MTSGHLTHPPALGEATVRELRDALRGELVLPGDAAYDEARSVWNGMIDRHPAMIARCTGTSDVIAAIGFARSEGLTVAVRGGGTTWQETRPATVARDRSLADEGHTGRRRRPHRPCAGRPDVGRARQGDTVLRSRDDRRARDHNRDRRLHPRRRHRLDDAQTRVGLRQLDLRRPGHSRRADARP